MHIMYPNRWVGYDRLHCIALGIGILLQDPYTLLNILEIYTLQLKYITGVCFQGAICIMQFSLRPSCWTLLQKGKAFILCLLENNEVHILPNSRIQDPSILWCECCSVNGLYLPCCAVLNTHSLYWNFTDFQCLQRQLDFARFTKKMLLYYLVSGYYSRYVGHFINLLLRRVICLLSN